MKIALIGLGKMGSNLCQNMMDHGHDVVVFDIDQKAVKEMCAVGALGVSSLAEAAEALPKPRVFWLMVPAGPIVDSLIAELIPLLDADDIVIDGGNSKYTQTQARCRQLQEHGIHFVDVGTSGGMSGARYGTCLMVGGTGQAVEHLVDLFEDVTVPGGFLHCGPSGSGHFVKMVHNGIEYGMMQAIAEGFDLMENSPFELDLPEVARVFRHGSVIRSWLMDLTECALREDPKLNSLLPMARTSGEGQWTVETAVELGIPVPVITQALFVRWQSTSPGFGLRLVASLRNQFGGHTVDPSVEN